MGSKRQKTNQRIKNRKGEGEFQGWEAWKVSQSVSLQVSGVDCDEGSGRLSAVSFAARSPKRSHTHCKATCSQTASTVQTTDLACTRERKRETHWNIERETLRRRPTLWGARAAAAEVSTLLRPHLTPILAQKRLKQKAKSRFVSVVFSAEPRARTQEQIEKGKMGRRKSSRRRSSGGGKW